MSDWRKDFDSAFAVTKPTELTKPTKSESSVISVSSVSRKQKCKTDLPESAIPTEHERSCNAVSTAEAELQHCIHCNHDRRSKYNPPDGLTGCVVRDDVPLMMPGSAWLSAHCLRCNHEQSTRVRHLHIKIRGLSQLIFKAPSTQE